MDEKLPPPSPQEQEQRLAEERRSRRTFLMNIGILLNAAVGLAIATPVVGYVFFSQAEDGIRHFHVTGVQTCALPISYCPCFRSSTMRWPRASCWSVALS